MKHLLLSLLLGLLTTNAYATQARLIALGMDELDDEGSYYIKDSRNIFLNSAYINDFADRLIIEWGSTGTAAGTGATVEKDTTPKAQGGFFKKSGNFVWGAYYGNESNTSSFLRIASTGNASALNAAAGSITGTSSANLKVVPTADNQIDLFFGGENGVQWGVNVVYLNNDSDTEKVEDTASAVRLGVKDGDAWDFHVNLSTSNKAERTADVTYTGAIAALSETGVKNEFKGKFGIHVGGSYDLGAWGRPYAYVKTFSWEQVDNYSKYASWTGTLATLKGKQGTSDGSFATYVVGWGKVQEISATDKLFYGIHVKKIDVELKLVSTVEVNNTTVPLTLGYEAAATSWLTLRGNITHNLYGVKDNKNFSSANLVAKSLVTEVYGAEGKGTVANSTVITAGASLIFGDLVFDGMIGTNDAASKTNGNLTLSTLMTTVAMTYAF